ncbi:transcription cofactor vestigial-like protein 3 isoform X2 [Stegostoma tigrinum]|uniref:transcription cofactor vestigial-like protein 3 isoform X2 n=1 Tax=Stegostoma tigrinum TaxID=3053191 RepID=UPI00202B0607|nr:transcription cofactor vestigial-like protein 3 isoform X2 [Stegostoma tigrinum]
MSCLDVRYHQSYGAHQYLPAAAYTAYTAACYRHRHSQQKLALYSKVQESMENTSQSKEGEKDQPPEAEYISSRCVLLTYFQGDIGAVVDEHFSRALSNFPGENRNSKPLASSSSAWKEGLPFSTNQKNFPASFWSSTYQAPATPALSASQTDISAATGSVFHSPDPMAWPGHGLHQASAPPSNVEPWPYTLSSQGSSSYPLVHEVYPHMHHPHAHTHHHSPHLDPRYGSLLVPSMRAARITTASGEIRKTDPIAPAAGSSWTGAFHGTLEMAQAVNFDTALWYGGSLTG